MLFNRNLILIDASLTGGRGPAKKAYELICDLEENKIPFAIITDRAFCIKLKELGVKPNYIVDTDLNEKPSVIIQKFDEAIRKINFDLLVKFGARVAGPIAARKMGKPYILVDGGLPDYLTNEESLYERKTFEQAKKVFLTTQFPWRFPLSSGLINLEAVAFPLSQKTWNYLSKLEALSKQEILSSVKYKISGKISGKKELLINLVMTGDYFNIKNRVTYGGWLTSKQYDQCVGFVRRLINDLGERFLGKKISIFMEPEVKTVITDLINKYPNVNIISFTKGWDYNTELAMQAAADFTISRATNYQPYIAALAKGGNVTTPVPADGYMNEDSAAIQYETSGMTKSISYADENYADKLIAFIKDNSQQDAIRGNLQKNRTFMIENNLNQRIKEDT